MKKYESQYKIIVLIEPSGLFQKGNLISFYYNDKIEEIICIGNIIKIQGDKKIQVELINSYLDEHEKLIEKLANNDMDTIKKIIVKPYISKEFLDSALTNWLKGA